MPFHLTARVQGREALFRDLEPGIIRLLRETAQYTDATVLAYAVMPNHLHIVLVQGTRELREIMQPLLRRIALLVQRRHQREGHVFERRYNATVCRDPEYLRNAIVYVHLNPVRAALCKEPGEYSWTSHHEFLAAASATNELPGDRAVQSALRLFSRSKDCTVPASCRDYGAFLAWRLRMDRHLENGGSPLAPWLPPKPLTDGGDRHWLDVYGACSAVEGAIGGYGIDLRDLALRALATCAPQIELDDLRCGGRTATLVRARRQLIVRALDAGYRPVQIARFLHISASAVSQAARAR